MFSNIVNLCEEEAILQMGMKLKFSIDKNNSSRAFKVVIDNVPASNLTKGAVVQVFHDVYIVESLDGYRTHVEVHHQKLPQFCLPVLAGDEVDFVLAQAHGNPSAR